MPKFKNKVRKCAYFIFKNAQAMKNHTNAKERVLALVPHLHGYHKYSTRYLVQVLVVSTITITIINN